MLEPKNISETNPLKQTNSNPFIRQDPNSSIQSNFNLINDNPMRNFHFLNNVNDQNIKKAPKKEEDKKNQIQPNYQMQLKIYFSFRNYPLIVVGPGGKYLLD